VALLRLVASTAYPPPPASAIVVLHTVRRPRSSSLPYDASRLKNTGPATMLQALGREHLHGSHTMKLGAAFAFGLLIGLAVAGLAGRGASDDAPETPIGPKWWPSEWGPADQRGAANRQTAAHVKEAAALIREGNVYSLGRVYEHGMP